MISFKGLKLQDIADLYDRSNPVIQIWMHENIHLWGEENRDDFKGIGLIVRYINTSRTGRFDRGHQIDSRGKLSYITFCRIKLKVFARTTSAYASD